MFGYFASLFSSFFLFSHPILEVQPEPVHRLVGALFQNRGLSHHTEQGGTLREREFLNSLANIGMEAKILQMKHLVKSLLQNRDLSNHAKQEGTLREREGVLTYPSNIEMVNKYFTIGTPGKVRDEEQESITPH